MTIVAAVVAAGAAPPSAAIDPLTKSLADAQAHTAALAQHAATTPEATLDRPADDEYEAFAAVTAADDALPDVERDPQVALPPDRARSLGAAIESAHASLRAYTRARMLGDRRGMREAATDAMTELSRARALLPRDAGPPQE